MPQFIIHEERREIYSATIEAEDIEQAERLYWDDAEEVFGDQWEHEETNFTELMLIMELDETNTKTVLTHVYEDGKLQDSF